MRRPRLNRIWVVTVVAVLGLAVVAVLALTGGAPNLDETVAGESKGRSESASPSTGISA